MAEETSNLGSVDTATDLNTENKTTESNFKDIIPQEYKSERCLENYKDINGLVKSHVELNKMIGDRVKIPGENSTKEEIDKFYNKLGRPESADKYSLENPQTIPEGFELDKEATDKFTKIAFDLGLSNKQATELRNYYVNEAINEYQKSVIDEEKQEEDFVKIGRAKFGDNYDKILSNASQMIAENLPEETRNKLNNLDNEQLLVFTELLNNLSEKYIKPDTISNNYQPANTIDDQKKMLQDLITKRNNMGPMDPNIESIDKQIKDFYYNKGIKIY